MVCRLIAMAQAAATLSDEIRNYHGEMSLGVGPEGSGRNDVGGDRVQSDLQQHVGEGVGGDGSVTSQAGSEGLPHVGDREQVPADGAIVSDRMLAARSKRAQAGAALLLMVVDARDERLQLFERRLKIAVPGLTMEQYAKAGVAFENAQLLSKELVIVIGVVGQAIEPISAKAGPWGLACMQHGLCNHVSEGCYGSVAGVRVDIKVAVWNNASIRRHLDITDPGSSVRLIFDYGLYPSVHNNMFMRVGKFIDRTYDYLTDDSRLVDSPMQAWCTNQQRQLSILLRGYNAAEASVKQADFIQLHGRLCPNCPIDVQHQFSLRGAEARGRMALAVDVEKWRGIIRGDAAAAAAEPAEAIIAPAGPAVAVVAASASAMDVDVAVPGVGDTSGVPALGAAAGHLPSSSVERPSVFSRLELRPSGIPPPRPPPGDPPVINQTPPELIRPFEPRHKELFVASTFEQRQAWISVQCAMPHLGHKLVAIPHFEALYKDGMEGLKLRPYGYGQHN